ncbi:uncharacterized protein LOC128211383 isoform X2 [Mya arenaria]|uniref:uncharacterized protein LOC128211383 isoform X2 n=1 Tax=Mya arenaria TaxID=6604 RepID=UPI0022E4371B|nr:uncharacterized protein LOC128211383 isoform X2 [Mya arenaria]
MTDSDDPRKSHRTFRDSQNSNAGLPLNEGYQYYPRYYPSWSWGGSEQTYNMAANTGIEGGRFYQVSEDGKRYEYPGMAAYDNVGAFGGRPSKGGSYKLKPPSDMSDGTTSFGSPAGRRRCCVVMSIVGLFLLVAAGVAIGIYFGVVDKPGNEQQTSTMSPVAAKSIQLTMAVEGTYSSALDDPASPEYQAKEQAVIKEVDEAMADTQMANSYIGFRVDGFSNGSIIVHGQAEFQAATYRNIDGSTMTITKDNMKSQLMASLERKPTTGIVIDTIQTADVVTPGGSVALGESCASRSDCSVVQAECTGNPSVCTCKSTHFDNNGGLSQGVCLIKKGYGTSCTAKTNCATVDSICSQTAGCSCPENKFYKADTDSCVLKLDFGAGDCTDASKQCSTSNAICTVNKCACENANFLKDGVCVPKITHGNSGCNTNTNCKTGSATCALGTCSCSGNKYYDSNSDICAPKIVNGLPCESRDMCLFSNASCIETKCSCTDSQYELGSACLDKVQNGEACSMDRACIITNAQCLEMACTCDSTRFLQGLACVEKKGQGESCTGKGQCLGTGTVCAANLCDCPSGQFFHTDTQTCIDKYEIGVECQNTMQCLPIDSECSQNEDSTKTVCQCPASKYLVGTACLDRLDLGETCDISGPEKQCLYSSSQCSGTQPTCQCPDSMYANAGTKTCIPKIAFGASCVGDHQCYMDGVCSSGICDCAETYYQDTNRCSMKKGLEGSCAAVEECLYSSAECTEGKCQCGSDYYVDNTAKACVQRVDQGSSCTDALQCKVGGATCLGDVCACTDTQFLDEANNRCADKITDGACDSADMCLHENAECVSFQCTCPADRYLDEDNKACALKKAQGESCTESRQCAVNGASCDSVCKCTDTQYEDSTGCKQKIQNGNSCSNTVQCLVNNAVCDESSLCTCVITDYLEGNDCFPKKANGESCNLRVECSVTNAECIDSLCGCSATHYISADGNTCILKKAYGLNCDTAEQCATENAACSGTCTCNDDSFHDTSDGADVCTQKLDYEATGCTEASQCKTGNAVCDSSTCMCTSNNYYQPDECLLKRGDNEACDNAAQCLRGNSECDQVCGCPGNMYMDDSTSPPQCSNKLAYEAVCTSEVQCITSAALCVAMETASQCMCSANYFHDSTNDKCTFKVLFGEQCSQAADCVTPGAMCEGTPTTVCTCAEGFYYDDVSCREKKANGVVCGTVGECSVTNSVCSSTCQCPEGTFLNGSQCSNKLMNGEACTDTLQCRVQSADCDGTCQCDALRYLDGDACLLLKAHSEFCESAEQCSTGACDNHQCSCLDGQYYSTAEGACKDKIGYNINCNNEAGECVTVHAECLFDVCACPDTYYVSLDRTQCFDRIGDGGICANDDECSYTNAACVETQCTCGAGYYVNHTGLACEQTKPIGGSCSSSEECGFPGSGCVSGTCACSDNMYEGADACEDKKLNGEACGVMEECLVTSAQCLSSACSCSQDQYLENLECRAKLGYNQPCDADITDQCMSMFVCSSNNVCDCPEGEEYSIDACIQVITTTPIPTTPAPDEIVFVDVDGEVTFNQTYDPALNDTTSETFQNYASDFQTALIDSDPSIESVTVTGISEGSVMVVFIVRYIKIEVAINVTDGGNQEPADVDALIDLEQQIKAKVTRTLLKVLQEDFTEKMKNSTYFRNLEPPKETAVKVKEDPCRDLGEIAKRAQSVQCQTVLSYTQITSNIEARCTGYRLLLDCVMIGYKHDNRSCPANTMRKTLEDLGLGSLQLKQEVKNCVSGNNYRFEPIEPVDIERPCHDLTNMKIAATIACREHMQAISNSKEPCSFVDPLFNCTLTELVRMYRNSSDTAMCPEGNPSRNFMVTALIKHQNDLFKGKSVNLETCEFFLVPNMQYHTRAKCGMELFILRNSSEEDLCWNIQSVKLCLEGHVKAWNKPSSADAVLTFVRSQGFLDIVQPIRPELTLEHLQKCAEYNTESLCDSNYTDIHELGRIWCGSQLYEHFRYYYEVLRRDSAGADVHLLNCIYLRLIEQCVKRVSAHYMQNCTSVEYREITEALPAQYLPFQSNTSSCFDDVCLSTANIDRCLDIELLMKANNYQNVCMVAELTIQCMTSTLQMECLPRTVLTNFLISMLEEAQSRNEVMGLEGFVNIIQQCPVEDLKPIDLCTDVDRLVTLGRIMCGDFAYNITENCRGAVQATSCLRNGLDMYSSQCTEEARVSAVHRAWVRLLTQQAMEHRINCFLGDRDSTCPNVDDQYCRTCVGREPDTCDVHDDCGEDLCCSDGCSRKCIAPSTVTEPMMEKPGTCPIYAFDANLGSGCCDDTSCSGTRKCCQIGDTMYNGMNSCVEPANVTLCNDTEAVMSVMPVCNLTQEAVASLTCESLIRNASCMADQLNAGRPLFTECVRGSVIQALGVNQRNLTSCMEYNVTVYFNNEIMNDTAARKKRQIPDSHICNQQLVDQYMPIIISKMMFGDGATSAHYRTMWCNNAFIYLTFSLYTDIQEHEIYNLLQPLFSTYNNPDLPSGISYYSQTVDLFKINRCSDPKTLKGVALHCLRSDAYRDFADWQICSFGEKINQCIVDVVHGLADNHYQDGECGVYDLLNNRKLLEDLIDDLRVHPDIPANYLDRLQGFNPDQCMKEGDIYPCNDDTNFKLFYDECYATLVEDEGISFNFLDDPNQNYGITPQLCGVYHEIVSCVGIKTREPGEDCSFYDVQRYVYNQLRWQPTGNNLPIYDESYSIRDYCRAYQPVCSAEYIMDARYGDCYGNYWDYYQNDCKNSLDRDHVKKFMKCAKTRAVLRGETDCTMEALRDLIKSDSLNLGLTKRGVDFDTCINDEDITELNNLFSGSVCTMTPVIEHLSKSCADTRDSCPGALNNLVTENSRAGCSFLTHTFSCVNTNLTSYGCTVDQMLDTSFPEDSLFHLSSDNKDKCREYLTEAAYTSCFKPAFYENRMAAFNCVNLTDIARHVLDADDPTLCRMREYSVRCLGNLATDAGVQCSTQDLTQALTDSMGILETIQRIADCRTFEASDVFGTCPDITTVTDNSCTDKTFISDIAVAVCLPQLQQWYMYNNTDTMYNNTGMQNNNTMMQNGTSQNGTMQNATIQNGTRQDRTFNASCITFGDLKSCTMNTTRRLLPMIEGEKTSCAMTDIEGAFEEHSQLISQKLGLNITTCQGACFQNLREIVHNCSLDIGYYSSYEIPYCRKQQYMYQCVDGALYRQNNMKPCGAENINSAIRVATGGKFNGCPDPRQERPVDVCNNVTDFASLAVQSCMEQLRWLGNSTDLLTDACNTTLKSRVESCFRSTVPKFSPASNCLNDTSRLNDKIVEAILQAATMLSMYETKIVIPIRKCYDDGEEKPGFCPVMDRCNMHYGPDSVVNMCTKDSHCYDGDKCCHDGCRLRCMKTAYEQALFEVRFNLPNELYDRQFEFETSEYSSMIIQMFEILDLYSLTYNFSSVRKSLAGTTDVFFSVKTFHLLTLFDLTRAMKRITENDNEVILSYVQILSEKTRGQCPASSNVYPYETLCDNDYHCRYQFQADDYKCCYDNGMRCLHTENETQSKCSSMYDLYEVTRGYCQEERNLFLQNLEQHSWAACGVVQRFTSCMTDMLKIVWPDCVNAPDMFLYGLHQYVDIIKEKEDKWELHVMVDFQACRENLCYNDSAIVNSLGGRCAGNVSAFISYGQMNSQSCNALLMTADCVANDLEQRSYNRYRCERQELYEFLSGGAKNFTGQSWVDPEICNSLVCFTPNLPRYIQDDSLCGKAGNRYLDNDRHNCRDFESLVFCIMLYGTEQETCFAQTLVPMVMRALSHINSTLRNPEPMCSDACNFTWTPMSQPAENRITINMTVHPRRNTTVVSTFIPALSSGIDMNSAGKWIGIGVNPEKQMTGTDAFTIENMDGMTFKVNNRYASARARPNIDTYNNFSVDVRSDETGTKFSFQRPIGSASGTPNDRPLNGPLFLIVAHGDSSNGQIQKHSTKYTSDEAIDFTCPTAYERLNRQLPMDGNMCNNVATIRFILEFECIEDLNYTWMNDRDRCLMDNYFFGCLLSKMAKFNCTPGEVATQFESTEVRTGIIGMETAGCELDLDSCNREMLLNSWALSDTCTTPLISLWRVPNINEARSADGKKSLKCSVYEQFYGCYVIHYEFSSPNQCQIEDYTEVAMEMVRLYQMISVSQIPNFTIPAQNINFTGCQSENLTVVLPDPCDDGSALLDRMSVVCLGPISQSFKMMNYPPGCHMLPSVMECMASYNHCWDRESKEEQDARFVRALQENPSFVEQILGFDPVPCVRLAECQSQLDESTSRWPEMTSYGMALLGLSNMSTNETTKNQRCALFNDYHINYVDWLKKDVPQCEDMAELFLESRLPSLNAYFTMNNWTHCTWDEDPCAEAGFVKMMQCIMVAGDACAYRDCVVKKALPQCGTEGVIEAVEQEYMLHRGEQMPQCDASNCLVSYNNTVQMWYAYTVKYYYMSGYGSFLAKEQYCMVQLKFFNEIRRQLDSSLAICRDQLDVFMTRLKEDWDAASQQAGHEPCDFDNIDRCQDYEAVLMFNCYNSNENDSCRFWECVDDTFRSNFSGCSVSQKDYQDKVNMLFDKLYTARPKPCNTVEPCSSSYFEVATTEACKPFYEKYLNQMDCGSYELFLGCINVQSYGYHNRTCGIRKIHMYVASRIHQLTGFLPSICGQTTQMMTMDGKVNLEVTLNLPGSIQLAFEIDLDLDTQQVLTKIDDLRVRRQAEGISDIISIRNVSGRIIAVDMFSNSSLTEADTMYGGSNDVRIIDIRSENGKTQVVVERPANATDMYDLGLQGTMSLTLGYAPIDGPYTLLEASQIDTSFYDVFSMLDNNFPMHPENLCDNEYILSAMLETLCLIDDYYEEGASNQTMCLAEYRSVVCLGDKLSDMAKCDDMTIREVLNRPSVRERFFNKTDPSCDKEFPCEMFMLAHGEYIGPVCLASIITLVHTPVDNILNVNQINSSQTMACNVWTQAMKCAYGTMMATDYSFTTSCSLESQFKPALVALAHMSTENSEPGPAHDVDYFNQCASSQENIFDSCPTKDELLYTTVAACGLGVLSSGEQYQYQCRYLRGCTDAIKGAYMTYCPQIDDLVDAGWQNLTYANYIESVIGFNPSSCGDEPRKCDDACPEIFKPVCAIHMDSDMMMTFDNQCFLDIANCQEGNRWMFKSDHACDYMESKCSEAMYMKVMEEDCEQWLERFKNTDNCGSYEGLLGCINTNILTETMMKCRFSDISRSFSNMCTSKRDLCLMLVT